MSKEKQKILRKQVSVYEKADAKSSIWQLINTLVPFILLWFFAYKSLSVSYLLSLPFIVLAAGFLVRIFIIFHDCCHYSFFKNRKANQILGTITGVITLFPYNQWQHSHAIHHASSGNLDKRGVGDIWLLTVDEYKEMSPLKRVQYRIYRNPFVMFIIGPIFEFLIKQRFNEKGARPKEKRNTYLTNLLILILYGGLMLLVGWKAFLLIHLPIFWLSGSMGIWLFYVQHQFEDSYFEWDEKWEYIKAAVEGSSFYKLPKFLQWMTGNIGYHHVHHLSPKVPNYQLEKAHNNTDVLKNVPTVTLKTSLFALKFRLWDDETKTFINFKEFKKKNLSK